MGIYANSYLINDLLAFKLFFNIPLHTTKPIYNVLNGIC